MNGIISTILNYIWVFIKLLFFCAILSLPVIGIIYFLKGLFQKFNKKYSFILSLFISIFAFVYVSLLFLYFIPILSKFSEFAFLDAVGFILFHLARLIIVGALFSGIILIAGIFVSLLYDNYNKSKKLKSKKKNEDKINFFNLWKSLTIVLVVIFCFIFIVFPRLPVIILYLIYM